MLKRRKKKLLTKLQYINNTWGINLLKEIEYHYYSKRYTDIKVLSKYDNKGISLIKKFIRNMYIKFGEANKKKGKKEEEDILGA